MASYISLHDANSIQISSVKRLERDGVNGDKPFFCLDINIYGDDGDTKITVFADSEEALSLYVQDGTPIRSSQPPVIEPMQPVA